MFNPIQFGAKYQIFFPQEILPQVTQGFKKLDESDDDIVVFDLKPSEIPHDKNNPEVADLLRRRVTITPDDNKESFTFETSQEVKEKNWDQHLVYAAIKRIGLQVGIDDTTLKRLRKSLQGLKVETKPEHIYTVNDYYLELPEGITATTLNNTLPKNKYMTFLNMAIKNGDNSMVQSLLAHSEIDPNKTNGSAAGISPEDKGLSPVRTAIKYKNNTALMLLLDHPKTNITPHIISQLVEDENLLGLELMINHDKVNINAAVKSATPLYTAVQKIKKPAIVNSLIQDKEIDPNITMKLTEKVDNKAVVKVSWPPICATALEDTPEIMEALLSLNNIDVNATSFHKENPKFNQMTALHYAIKRGHGETVELLLNDPRVKTDIKNTEDKDALDFIFDSNNVDFFRLYTNRLSDEELMTPDESGSTLLGRSLAEGKAGFAKYILQDRQIDLTEANSRGITPLHMVAMHGNEELVEYLWDQPNIDPFVKDIQGWTPFHWAVFKQQENIVDLYINHFNTQVETLTETDQELIDLYSTLQK